MSKPSQSVEDYLEALLMLEEAKKPLEITGVSQILKVSKPAATQMMADLKEKGYIDKEPYGDITLTASGRQIGTRTYHRHKVLCRYLTSIGVSDNVAEEDCCRIEHVISDETFQAIEKQLSTKEK